MSGNWAEGSYELSAQLYVLICGKAVSGRLSVLSDYKMKKFCVTRGRYSLTISYPTPR